MCLNVHIWGEDELNQLSSCLMNVTVNASILASVNDMLVHFIFLSLAASFQAKTPAKSHVNQL